MAASNSHNSETTSALATKRGIGIGSIAFSDVILLKSLSTKLEAPKVGNGAIFAKKCGDNTADLVHVWTKVPGGRKWVMSKYYMGDYMQALCWLVTVD